MYTDTVCSAVLWMSVGKFRLDGVNIDTQRSEIGKERKRDRRKECALIECCLSICESADFCLLLTLFADVKVFRPRRHSLNGLQKSDYEGRQVITGSYHVVPPPTSASSIDQYFY